MSTCGRSASIYSRRRIPWADSKPTIFLALGYDANAWTVLEANLRETLESDKVEAIEGEFGTKFVVRSIITSPSETKSRLITVWIVLNGEENPRFVTPYPES